MFLLSDNAVERWKALGRTAASKTSTPPPTVARDIEEDLKAPFYYFVGTMFGAKGKMAAAKKWLGEGQRVEPFPACAYMLDLIGRQGDTMKIPEFTFTNPKPWEYFSSLPELRTARENFLQRAVQSLPGFERPFSLLDIGCGNGDMGVRLIRELLDARKITEVRSVMLLDPSRRMLKLAQENMKKAYPAAKVRCLETKLENAGPLDDDYDVALASSSIHHMPAETKKAHIEKLGGSIDHFLLLELEGNHDYPEMHSPELAFSAYQVFGRALQFIFSQDAPADVQRQCADIFLMTEAISILSQPRGQRTEYHMLRSQWRALLDEALGEEFCCVCDSTCYADPYVEQVMMHYSRDAG